MNRKHPQAAGRENIAPVAPPNLQQRQSAASLFKLPVPGNAIKQHSIPGSGYPSRSAAQSPVRTGSPVPYQQGNAQHAILTQTTVQGNIQDQGYSQPGISAWAESTLGTDSDDTARDESQNVYEMDVESDHDEERNEIFESDDQRMEQDGQIFDGEEIEEEEEEEGSEEDLDQFNMLKQRRPNSVNQLPIANVSIPMRSGYTNRFSGEPQQQQLQPNGDGAMIEDEKHVAQHLEHQQSAAHNQFPIRDSFAPSEMDEDTVHSEIGDKSQAARSSVKRPHAPTVDLDFDQEKLFQMPYEELKIQAFEDDPNSTKLGKTPMGSHESLEGRLDMYKSEPVKIQQEFFASLPIDEWEQAGEWFLAQFGQSMTKIAEARRERRNIATGFEKQFADRDAVIKKKTENLNAVFTRMQSGGESILRGKTPS